MRFSRPCKQDCVWIKLLGVSPQIWMSAVPVGWVCKTILLPSDCILKRFKLTVCWFDFFFFFFIRWVQECCCCCCSSWETWRSSWLCWSELEWPNHGKNVRTSESGSFFFFNINSGFLFFNQGYEHTLTSLGSFALILIFQHSKSFILP